MPKTLSFLSLVLVYLCGISLVSVAVTVWDKHRAAVHKRRVPEATLLLLSALGGSLAMYAAMRLIRHKTRKSKFMVGIPVIFSLQAAAAVGIWYWAACISG